MRSRILPTAVVGATVAALGLAFAPAPTAHVLSPADLPTTTVGAVATGATPFEPAGMVMQDCSQLFGPAATSTDHLLFGDTVDLSVLLVMDLEDSTSLDAIVDDPATAVDERQAAIDARGEEIVEEYLAVGEQSYDDLAISLTYAAFDVLGSSYLGAATRPETIDAQGTIDTAKAQYGGVRPEGIDVVYVLTDLDLTAPGLGSAVAGLADCIGGVAYDDRAFGVGEIDYDRGQDPGDLLDREFTGKIVSHEIGHLMGAHHHYQACGPYAATNLADGYGIGACTLMTNAVNFATFPFSPVNGIVVRGHAEEWAAANDPTNAHDH